MDYGGRFRELMEQKVLWEKWYTRRFSRSDVGTLSADERRLLDMDPNEFLDPALLAYLHHQISDRAAP